MQIHYKFLYHAYESGNMSINLKKNRNSNLTEKKEQIRIEDPKNISKVSMKQINKIKIIIF